MKDIMTDLPFNVSARHLQSEYGVAGDYSLNIELITQVAANLTAGFKGNEQDELTRRDAFVFFSECYLGAKIDDKSVHMTTLITTGGSGQNLATMLSKALMRCPSLVPIFATAMSVAMENISKMPPPQQTPPSEPNQ